MKSINWKIQKLSLLLALLVLLGGCFADDDDPAPANVPPVTAPGPGPGPGDEPDYNSFSPGNWSDEEKAEFRFEPYEKLSEDPIVASGNYGIVAVTDQTIAARIGRKVLEAGGSAVDAILATSFVQIVMNAGSYNTFAGQAVMIHYDASTNETLVIDGPWRALHNVDYSERGASSQEPSGLDVMAHGYIAAAGEAHRRWGKLPWERLFDGAIWLAEEGIIVDGIFARGMAQRAPFILRTPEGREIFLKEDGTPYVEGDRFKQPQLAKTLKGLATHGWRYLYEGPWAQKWVELVNREGGQRRAQRADTLPIGRRTANYRVDSWGYYCCRPEFEIRSANH